MDRLKAGRPSSTKKIMTIDDLKDDEKAFTIKMRRAFHKQIKQLAIEKDKTMNEFIMEILEKEFGK